MLKRKSRTIAINAVFLAILLASTLMSLIPIAGAGLAVLSLITLVVASQIEGYRTSLFMGLAFGLISFALSYISASPTAPIFRNPLVSILPRVFIALLGYLIYKGVIRLSRHICDKSKSKKVSDKLINLIASAIGSAFTVLFNTLFVLLMIYALYYGKDVGGTAISTEFIMGLISINFAVEIIGTTLLAPPIVLVVGKYVANLKMTVADSDSLEEPIILDVIDDGVEKTSENNQTDIVAAVGDENSRTDYDDTASGLNKNDIESER